MESQEPGNNAGKSAGTGTPEHHARDEKEHPGRDAQQTPDGIQANVAGTSGGTGETDNEPVIAHPVGDVERKTELHGMSSKPPDDPSRVRRRTERDLKDPGFGIPYGQTEKAVRDLVCSLIERQDRMNVSLFLEINSMNEDIGILKDQLYKLKTAKTGTNAGAKK